MGNTLKLDTKGLEGIIEKMERMEKNVKPVLTEALETAAKKIEQDTLRAIEKSNLPAKGKYSKGATKESVVKNAKVNWQGATAEIKVGFDYGMPGSGGLLITGTPKMKPVAQLQRIYKQRKYMQDIQNDMKEAFQREIDKN